MKWRLMGLVVGLTITVVTLDNRAPRYLYERVGPPETLAYRIIRRDTVRWVDSTSGHCIWHGPKLEPNVVMQSSSKYRYKCTGVFLTFNRPLPVGALATYPLRRPRPDTTRRQLQDTTRRTLAATMGSQRPARVGDGPYTLRSSYDTAGGRR
jgi:hypothetical protein